MEIKREGKPIRLTEGELEEAYRERKAEYLKMDLQGRTHIEVSDRLTELFDSTLQKSVTAKSVYTRFIHVDFHL